MGGIVVGVSASAAGAAALDWALEQAAQRGMALLAVRAWDIAAYGPYYSVGSALRSTSPDAELNELQIARDALAAAQQRVPMAAGVDAKAVARRGRPPEALVEAAQQAELLVLGSRGVGALSRVVHLGSVTSSVLHHAHGPVAVIPDAPSAPPTGRIAVGVDGSKASARALAWAVAHARTSGATLIPVAVLSDGASGDGEESSLRAAAEAAGAAGDAPVQVEPQVRHGNVSHELIAAAADADLLVIGSRGKGGFASLLLGSTSSQVAGHSTRPVVVVRPA